MIASVDVLICGGGLSGLAAALRCTEAGLDTALAEQTGSLGGRCSSYIDAATGDVVDNGQHVLLGAYRATMKYLGMVGSCGHLRSRSALHLPLIDPHLGYVPFTISALPRPFHLTAGMLKFRLLPWNERRRLLNVGLHLYRWNKALEAELSCLTVEEWLIAAGQSELARRSLWYPIAVSVMNEEPDRASALLFARSLRTAFLGGRADSAILLPDVGQTELYVAPAERILAERKCRVWKGEEVVSVEPAPRGGYRVRMKGGRLITASSVIMTVPPYSLGKVLPGPLRSVMPFASLNRIGSSPIVSVHLWFDEEIMEMDFAGCIGRSVQWVFNRRRITAHRGGPPGYLSCVISGARRFIGEPKEKLIAMAVDDIGEFFCRGRKPRTVHAIVIKEKRATFSPTNDVERLRPGTITPLRNYFLAGDWTATGLPATIEGAVASGFAAAEAAIRGI